MRDLQVREKETNQNIQMKKTILFFLFILDKKQENIYISNIYI
jgi:hypothetical protein